MVNTRDIFKKTRDTKGIFHAKRGSTQDKNGMDLTEAEDIKKRSYSTFCQTSKPWPTRFGWPNTAWLSFIELDKAVVWVMRLTSFFVIMVCASALWCLLQHLPSYLCFSYLGRGVSLHSCSSKVQPLLLFLNNRYLLTATPPDIKCGVAPLVPPAPMQPLLIAQTIQYHSNPSLWPNQ